MMNKQEAIEKINNITARETFMSEIIWVKRDEVIDIVKQIDEPKKAVVPQYIDTWIQGAEYNGFDLLEAMTLTDESKGELEVWIMNYPEIFAKAFIYGYEVEKEKRYTAKLKISNEYLSYDKDYKEIRHNRVPDDIAHKVEGYHFTEDDLIAYNAWEIMLMKLKMWKESKLCQIGLREQLN